MQTKNRISKLLVLFILFLNIAHNVTGTLWTDMSDKEKDSLKSSLFRIPLEDMITGDFLRHKRSVMTDHGYGSRLHAGSNVAKSTSTLRDVYGQYGPGKRSSLSEKLSLDEVRDLQRMKRIFSDYGYGSRLQAGENVANSYEHEDLFGIAGPGKRSAEVTDFYMLNKDMIKDKRVETDYGYGFRLQAVENVAMDWDRNGLFGVMGPGKRSDNDELNKRELSKRIVIDFGYGSRSQAAENAAKASSTDELFGVYGPGKRNSEYAITTDIPRYEILKHSSDYKYEPRLQAEQNVAKSLPNDELSGTYKYEKQKSDMALPKDILELELNKRLSSDFGYGSRMQTAANVAKSSSNLGLFGVYGPGKRSSVNDIQENEIIKRIHSDYGYGSRLHAAENAAKSSSNSELFGIYGPGKRNNGLVKRTISDYGYGSRLQAAENAAKSSSDSELFGIYGPGKRNNGLVRRTISDYGYGSRLQAAESAARLTSGEKLFGVYGPGK